MNKLTNNKNNTTTENMNEYEIPIADNFKLNAKKKLGSGAFGDIFYGYNLKVNLNQIQQNIHNCFTKLNYI